ARRDGAGGIEAGLEEVEPPADELAGAETGELGLPDLDEAEGEAESGEPEPAEVEPRPVPAERSLVRHDPLTAYIQEIRRVPLLTREEEHALAVRYFEQGDVDAARRLVEANLRLVVKIAHEEPAAYR